MHCAGGGRVAPLLDDMGQFVGDEALAFACAGVVFPGSKDDIAADGVCPRLIACRRLRRLLVGVDAHLAKVMTEARLHRCPCRRIQRLPACPWPRAFMRPRCRRKRRITGRNETIGHGCYRLSDPIRLLLMGIARLADTPLQLWLA